jgi:hypothetical protein
LHQSLGDRAAAEELHRWWRPVRTTLARCTFPPGSRRRRSRS